MVKHIVMWDFREEIGPEERLAAAARIKRELEGLVGTVPGLLRAEVITEPIPSSTHDLSLVTEMESREALKGYKDHPAHLKAASFVRSVTCHRACLDYDA